MIPGRRPSIPGSTPSLDDAAGVPPFENLSVYAEMGLDLYCFSGGKGLRCPQSSGVLLGRRDLIEAALAQSTPWEGAVCRPMKVGKEEIIGVLTAIEAWARLDLDELNRDWLAKVETIAEIVESVPAVTTEITIPEGDNRYPTLAVLWDEQAFGLTVADCDRELRAGEPRIEVLTSANPSLVTAVPFEALQETEKTAGTPEDKLRLVSGSAPDAGGSLETPAAQSQRVSHFRRIPTERPSQSGTGSLRCAATMHS